MNADLQLLDALPGLPQDADGPVFEAPWQAHAFAMTLSLHERGVFTWSEWLKALEGLVTSKGVTSKVELARYERAWHNAAQRTVHGTPIVLSAVDLDQ